jgi:hypothetical protein
MLQNPSGQPRDRQKPLRVFVSPAEREEIERLANEAGLTLSAYLRTAALRQKIESAIDQKAALDLLKAMADLGRLGGLLKLWLVSKPGTAATEEEVRRALREIEASQIKLRALIDRI